MTDWVVNVVARVGSAGHTAAIEAMKRGETPHRQTKRAMEEMLRCAVANGLVTVTDPEGCRRALYVGPRSDTMVAHRLGASRCGDSLVGKSLQRKAPGGVLHAYLKASPQDPG